MNPAMKKLVVIGGGISGVAAAWRAAAQADRVPGGLEVHLFERDAAPGGKARTHRQDGWLVETGPTAFMGDEPAVDELVAAAGLESERIAADEAAAHRFVVRGGTMREVSANPIRFARSGILGPAGLLRIALEPLVPARRDGADESVWSFAARRIGRQAADRLIAPMVLGVFAGDARRLSLPAAFPRLAALEREHGSLVRGMIALKRSRSARPRGGPAGSSAPLWSFREGMQTLPRALARRGRFEVHCGAAAAAIEATADGRFRVRFERDGACDADAVVVATEPWAAAPLLRPLSPEAARELDGITCPPVLVVALGYHGDAAPGIPRGFGVLVPRGEGLRILGCLFDTYLFPGRSPERHLLLRAMLGGAVDPEIAGADDAALVATVREDLRRLAGITATPVFVSITRWPRAIPQYELGHLDRVRRIEERLSRWPALALAGNGLHGIAFGKAAAAGLRAADRVLEALARPVTARAD
ncbi:MAG: protoporphyrinogen oxidase [Acidobacteria bacterium]|nr:MAG: protoporphyrinogen oxidase [Acidobacteriota bacterium]